MCITLPARVLAVDGATAKVEVDGRVRRASLMLEPDVMPGDWVIVGSGTVLRRLDPSEAHDIQRDIHAARSSTAAVSPTGGHR